LLTAHIFANGPSPNSARACTINRWWAACVAFHLRSDTLTRRFCCAPEESRPRVVVQHFPSVSTDDNFIIVQESELVEFLLPLDQLPVTEFTPICYNPFAVFENE